MNFPKELLNRIKLEAPDFHKKLIKIGSWLSGFALVIVSVPGTVKMLIPNSTLNLDFLVNIGAILLTIGLSIAGTSTTVVKNPDYPTLDK